LIEGKNLDVLARTVANPTPLRDRDLVKLDQARTDAIDVNNGSQVIKLRREGTQQWKVFMDGKGQKADFSAGQGLLKALTAPRQSRGSPAPGSPDAAPGRKKPIATVSAWVEGLQKEEKPG